MKKNKLTHILAIALIIVGCLQVAGYFLKSRNLRGLGFAFGASPLPTVFGTVKGVEGFTTRHTVFFLNKNSQTDSVLLDQRMFNQFKGSYFLKNSYSIFLAYPHMLKPGQVSAATDFLLCKRNLIKEFGLDESITDLSVQTRKNLYGKQEITTLKPACKK